MSDNYTKNIIANNSLVLAINEHHSLLTELFRLTSILPDVLIKFHVLEYYGEGLNTISSSFGNEITRNISRDRLVFMLELEKEHPMLRNAYVDNIESELSGKVNVRDGIVKHLDYSFSGER